MAKNVQVDIDYLTKKAWDKGTVFTNGKKWKVHKSEHKIGANNGKDIHF